MSLAKPRVPRECDKRREPGLRNPEAMLAEERGNLRRPPRAVRAVMLIAASSVLASLACASSPENRPVTAPRATTSSSSPPLILDVLTSTPSLAYAGDAATVRQACGGVTMRGSFCDALSEAWRVVKSDGEVRRCLERGSTKATSALAGIGMQCHAHPPWQADCAGNPPGQSEVIVDCRFYIGYEYGDKEHDMMPYLRGVAAAVAACDPAYRAAPIRSVGERDKATQFSRSEPDSPLQELIAVCSDLADLPPSEDEGRAEVIPAHYNIIMQVYGVGPDAGSPRSR